MSEYTIYCLVGGVRLVAAEWIDVDTDDEALKAAANMRPGTRREVWEYDRLVGSIEMDPGAN